MDPPQRRIWNSVGTNSFRVFVDTKRIAATDFGGKKPLMILKPAKSKNNHLNQMIEFLSYSLITIKNPRHLKDEQVIDAIWIVAF